jgi:hypothetical protein
MASASERALEKERRRYSTALFKELQRAVQRTAWKKRDDAIFQQRETFFFAAFPVVYLNADKVTWTLNAKPMAVDPVFWAIMDLETNAAEPLSLRALGWFVCDGLPVAESEVTPPLPSASDMATQFLAWAESSAADFMRRHAGHSFSDLIRDHVDYRERGAYATTLISTLIAEGRRNEAARLADEFRSGTRTAVLMQANEGSSFFDRAAAWLATQTR